jgi:error-prone DNA polymerase
LEAGQDGPAIRLGLRLVKGIREEQGRQLVVLREQQAFVSLADLATRTGLDRGALRQLARADAFQQLLQVESSQSDTLSEARTDRRAASFAVDGIWPGMFATLPRDPDHASLPQATAAEEMQADYSATGLTPGTHPIALVREELRRKRVTPLSRLIELPDNSSVTIAGLVGVRQRPDTASGVIFLMLEDETGTANVVIWPRLYQRQRKIVRTERLLVIRGTLQRMDGAISVVARHLRPLQIGANMQAKSRDFH